MNCQAFQAAFAEKFRGRLLNLPTYEYWDPIVSDRVDLCPDVEGKLSLKKQQLLNLAYRLLDEGEAYLEIGTFQGKSLLSAMIANPARPVFACDNFSQFDHNTYETLHDNLAKYGFSDRVAFFDCDFLEAYTASRLNVPIGMHFYDGAHDYGSQYEAIKRVEPFLAANALVLVDDWRYAPDSGSYAKEATMQAVSESAETWTLLYELAARLNGDRAMWWNGVGVLSFKRGS